ncbi:MAG: LysR family transcriptional regulator, partial [Mesorhizobium sp.]
ALFKNELADGRLIQPFDLVGDDGHAYWLVYPTARRNVPKIRAFRDWILAEIACQ